MTIGTGIAIVAIWGSVVGLIHVTGWKKRGAAVLIVLATLLTLTIAS